MHVYSKLISISLILFCNSMLFFLKTVFQTAVNYHR